MDAVQFDYIALMGSWLAFRDPEGFVGEGKSRQAAEDDLNEQEADWLDAQSPADVGCEFDA